MKWLIIAIVVVAAGYASFVMLERSAAPAFGSIASRETPTRQVSSGKYWRAPKVNQACRAICEPHCTARWGAGGWSALLRSGCFLNCVDVACKPE